MGLKHAALIEPALLRWAVARADVTRAELAKSAGTSEAIVEKWLAGDKQPSFVQLRKVASRLRVPLGVLFLSEPPDEPLPIADYRTVAGTKFEEPSTELRDVLHSVLRRKDWLSEYQQDTGAGPTQIVNSAVSRDSVPQLAAQIREALELENFKRPANSADFLRELVKRTEAAGINVARNGVVGNNTHRPLNVDEFRGFSISDPYAPYIFINGADSPAAQIFTLVHEIAHIVRGDTGISAQGVTNVGRIEAICNAVAAEVLVPRSEFSSVWDVNVELEDAVAAAAKHFRVSRYVIAIRAFENGLIAQGDLDNLLSTFRQQYQNRSKGSGGNFYSTLVTRNGRTFSTRVVEALDRQHLLTRDAASLLDTKVSKLNRLGREIADA